MREFQNLDFIFVRTGELIQDFYSPVHDVVSVLIFWGGGKGQLFEKMGDSTGIGNLVSGPRIDDYAHCAKTTMIWFRSHAQTVGQFCDLGLLAGMRFRGPDNWSGLGGGKVNIRL